MMATKKIEEGQELVRQAEKSLKTTLLKWKPDYDVAADEYSKAATCFRIAKSFDKSKECFMKAIECHKNNSSWFHAAKCYEQIIIILKDTDNFVEIEPTANKACSLYQQHGSPEAGASALDKAAKIVENKHPEVALRLYQHAMEVVLNEDSTRQAAEFATKVSRLMVKLKMFDQAANAILREISLNQATESYSQIGRLTVGLVLVQLARGDYVAAEKSYKEWGNCCDPQEIQTLEMLLQGFDEEDPDLARRALSSPFIKHMDVEYAILARDLPLPEGMPVAPKAAAKEKATGQHKPSHAETSSSAAEPPSDGAGAGAGAGLEEDEDEEGGLC